MFCPVCHSEYEPRARTCTDCRVALVSAVPVPPAPYRGEMRPAMRFETRAEALAVHDRLTAVGIRAYVPDDGWSEFGIFGSRYWSQCPLWIAEEDLERSRQVYAEMVEEWRAAARDPGRRDPDFYDYEAAGALTDADGFPGDGRRRSQVFRRITRVGAWVINGIFLLNLLDTLARGGKPALAAASVPLLLLVLGLFYLSRRA